MAEPIDGFDAAVAFALTLPDTELGTSYREPAVKVASNGRTFLNVGHEPDTSFVLHLDGALIEMLKERAPDTFWQSPHYEGYAAVLVRFDSPEPERVREMISRARDHVAAMKPARKR
jgi:hypothetical protein